MTDEPQAAVKRLRPAGRRHPLLRARPRGVWYADLAGVIKNYPKTQEAYDKMAERNRIQIARLVAEGKWTRVNVPNGWGRKKDKVSSIRADLRVEAEGIVKNMIAKGEVTLDDERAEEALVHLVSVIRDTETVDTKTRVAAAAKVLEFTKQKPAARNDVTLHKAEDFLAALVPKA